ncbi:hypothetical protein Tsp_14803 [Trichinella spiralis]|uniref:hypothetical protein n=1 Tax=Trichinella spiralis TaxID=6334 RepID=UPI0001EFD89E|nr:hypothetical protein Tsp_14803 [Trichinella spiralis]
MKCTVFDTLNPVCSAEYHGKEQLSLADSDSSPELALLLHLSAVYGRRTVSMPKKKENLLINVIPQCTTLHGLKKLKITASGRRNADSRANSYLALHTDGYTETMGMHDGQNSIAQILYGTSKVTVAHSYR